MSIPHEVLAQKTPSRNPNTPLRKKSYKLLIVAWIMLVCSGLGGAYLYTNYLKTELIAELASQNHIQLQSIQVDYQNQLTELKTNLDNDMNALQTKVDELNQLLAFTKDNASTKTDNSNQLYTQLAEVKKKLEELKKNLDVLK
jgi:peptidoglycan hydrolase CwlO-like protein